MTPRPQSSLALLLAVWLFISPHVSSQQARDRAPNPEPKPVSILGYAGDAMEPFLSRDGSLLLFNNRNDPADKADLHWAERIDDLTFRYRGPIAGANSSSLDGVPTLTRAGRLCFVSTRSYQESLATIYCADFRDGVAGKLMLQTGTSVNVLGRLMFDVEASSDGTLLILSDGRFVGGTAPAASDLRLAHESSEGYLLSQADDDLLTAINSPALEYAPALSPDGLTLAFTRFQGPSPFARPGIWLSTRTRADAPFSAPIRLASLSGFVEAPTFSPDGQAIYFHKKTGRRFGIWRVDLK